MAYIVKEFNYFEIFSVLGQSDLTEVQLCKQTVSEIIEKVTMLVVQETHRVHLNMHGNT